MTSPRDVLNELKWRHDALDEAVIHYVHRGAPGDTRVVTGEDVADVGQSFMELRGAHGRAMIPFHRVFRIERDGRVVWERRTSASGSAD